MDDVPRGEERRNGPQSEDAAAEKSRRLYALAGRGLWPLALFALLSLWARTDFRYLPPMPQDWGRVMGRPPPPAWIDAAFVLYVFSAIVLSLTRMAGYGSPGTGFRHLGYLAAFYGFYFVSGVLPDNYWAVLVGGFVVLTLECYRNWLFYWQQIRDLDEEQRR